VPQNLFCDRFPPAAREQGKTGKARLSAFFTERTPVFAAVTLAPSSHEIGVAEATVAIHACVPHGLHRVRHGRRGAEAQITQPVTVENVQIFANDHAN